MRLGAGPIALRDVTGAQLENLAIQAMRSSFDAFWVAESRDQGVGGGLAAAAMLAQSVPIRLGAALDLGTYHPLYLAEDIAVADLATQGRIEVLLRVTGDWQEEHLRVLAMALSGAHIKWEGEHLHVPANIDANQPSPTRLALNPRPAQPVVPIWIENTGTWIEQAAQTLGFGLAAGWQRNAKVPVASGRWSGMMLCPNNVEPAALLAAAGDDAGYFVVTAENEDEIASAGRRLAGPLRMPEFPDWVNA